jgi:hypothetical protein
MAVAIDSIAPRAILRRPDTAVKGTILDGRSSPEPEEPGRDLP